MSSPSNQLLPSAFSLPPLGYVSVVRGYVPGMYIMYVHVLLHYLHHQSHSLVTPTTPTRHARTHLSLNTQPPKALLALCPLDQLKLHNRPEWES